MDRLKLTPAALLLAALLAGCDLIPKKEEPKPEPSPGAPAAEAPGAFAGRWTREGESPLVFEVSDDGQKVHGELVEGGGDAFDSYTFDLEHQAEGLKGQAHFVLKDVANRTYDTAWKARLDGDTIVVEQEFIELDEEGGEVVERGTEERRYAFEPAAVPEPVAAAPTMPAMDMSAYVSVMPSYKHLLYEGMEVGHQVLTVTEVMGTQQRERMALVGETDRAWIVEIDNQAGQKDLLLAVFVDKETGLPLEAYVGNRGQQGKKKDVPPPPPEGQGGQTPAGTPEEVTVPAGTFPTIRTETAGNVMWTVAEGHPAAGVLVKSATVAGTDELMTLEEVEVDVGGRPVRARHAAYTSGNSMWFALEPIYFNQALVRMETPQMKRHLAEMGGGAKAELQLPAPG